MISFFILCTIALVVCFTVSFSESEDARVAAFMVAVVASVIMGFAGATRLNHIWACEAGVGVYKTQVVDGKVETVFEYKTPVSQEKNK